MSDELSRKVVSLLKRSKKFRTGEDVVKSLKWVIFPDNKWIKRWDLLVLAGLFLLAFILPYQIGVSGGVAILTHVTWLVVNILLNAIFLVDTFLYFFRTYYRPDGSMVMDLKMIRRHYLRTYFVPNLVSVLPYTMMFYAVGSNYLDSTGEPNPEVQNFISFILYASLLKLIRLVRVRTIIRASDTVTTFRMKHNSQVLELLKYVWLIVAVSHWFACIWCFVVFIEADNFSEKAMLATPNWIAGWYADNAVDGGLYPLGWNHAVDRYILSLFWAIQTITSIGYGNVVPVTRAEYFVACVLQLCAGIMWAYVIGGLVGVVAGMGSRAEEFRTRIDQANDLIHQFSDPEEVTEDTHEQDAVTLDSKVVARHIRNYIHKQYSKSKGESCINTIPSLFPVLDTLTPDLQKASSVLLANRYLRVVPYLSSEYMSLNELSIVAMQCLNLDFNSGEAINTNNAVEGVGRGVYVFVSGSAFSLDKTSARKSSTSSENFKVKRFGLVTAGMCYGADTVLLADDNEAAKGRLKFLTFSHVVFIPRQAIMEALKKSPKAWKDCARWIYLRTLLLAKDKANMKESSKS